MRVMKRYTKGILAIVMLSCMATFTAVNSNATTVATDPGGYITQSIAGSAAGNFTYVSLGMTQFPVWRGAITSIGANTLTDSNALWATGQYTNTTFGSGYYIEITSAATTGGVNDVVGLTDDITNSASGGVLYTAYNNYYSNLAVGDTYKIYPHWTLDTAFGPPAQSGLAGAGTSAAADDVFVFNPSTQQTAEYWYKNTGSSASQGWKTSTSVAGPTVLYNDQGIIIQRNVASPTSWKLVGAVKLGPTLQPGVYLYNYVGNVYAAGFTLDSMVLYTTNTATGVAGGGTSSAADDVFVFNSSTQQTAEYWYKNTGSSASQGWKTGTSAAGSTAIPLGTVLVIERNLNASFNWTQPAPY